MKINKNVIAELRPCESRFNNYLKYYSDFNGDLGEFIKLENITYNDKVWVFVRLATKEQKVKWAALCAKSVLHIFEEKHPNDKRPRQAIDALLNSAVTYEVRKNARAAAYAAADAAYADAAAAYAADYAAYAAANAADAAAYAADYAAYAAANAADAADYAAYGATSATAYDDGAPIAARKLQQNLNLKLMLEAL